MLHAEPTTILAQICQCATIDEMAELITAHEKELEQISWDDFLEIFSRMTQLRRQVLDEVDEKIYKTRSKMREIYKRSSSKKE